MNINLKSLWDYLDRNFSAVAKACRDAPAVKKGACKWEQDLDQDQKWWTQCNGEHDFMNGSPDDHSFVFCPYCGLDIEVASPPSTKDEVQKPDPEPEAGPWQ